MSTLATIVSVFAATEGEEASKTAFYVLGLAAAGWALILTAVGMTRPDFPSPGGKVAVMVISVLAFAGAIGSAIATA